MLSQSTTPYSEENNSTPLHLDPASYPIESDLQDDDDFPVLHPSSDASQRSFKKLKHPKNVKLPLVSNSFSPKWKGKNKGTVITEGVPSGQCYLLDLPEDVLHLLLVRLPPRDLLVLGATCKLLHRELKSESLWRQCYVNRFLWDGAASSRQARADVEVLVQGCMNSGGRGWKRESLSRESMLERWTASRTSMVVHHPLNSLIHSLSLSYPPLLPGASKRPLVVGKVHKTTNSSSTAQDGSFPSTTPTPLSGKLSHRQKYEAMLAVSTRPPPHVYSAGLEVGGLVKSDPLTGKVSKGFWGPGSDANFHLRPHWDPGTAPSALFIPKRSQTHMLWGLLTGSCIHTTIQSRSHATHGGRATSINVTSSPDDMHDGPVACINQPESAHVSESLKWVTGGADGRVKYWCLNPGRSKSGKKTPTDAAPASISCLFTSDVVKAPLKNRTEEVALRQLAHPDAISLVACDLKHDVICGVTEDGDLRVWFDVVVGEPKEVRFDVGAADMFGGVSRLELDCRDLASAVVATVLVHHRSHPNIARYDISFNQAGEHDIKTTFFSTPSEAPLTVIFAHLQPTPPIVQANVEHSALSARIITPTGTLGTNSPIMTDGEDPDPKRVSQHDFGRFISAGDALGQVYIWAWDGQPVNDIVFPIREWTAMDGKITALDSSSGLLAVGSYDGRVEVFDPLPTPPTNLRGFRPSHLTPGDYIVAASNDFRASFYNVNHIILENDLVVAAIGRRVLAWRAGTGKGRQTGKESGAKTVRGGGGGGGGGGKGGHSRDMDLRSIHLDAVDSHYEIQARNVTARIQTSHELQHLAAMEDLGLEDGDDALQYALILSQQEADTTAAAAASPDSGITNEWVDQGAASRGHSGFHSDNEGDAMPTVNHYTPIEELADPDDLQEILEMIRIAEEREREQDR